MSNFETVNDYVATADDLNYNPEQSQTPETGAYEPERPVVKESNKDENFNTLRELRNEERRKREAAEQRARELEYQLQQRLQEQERKSRYVEPDADDEFDIDDDSYLEGKQVKKILSKINKRLKTTEEQFKQESQRNAVVNAERALMSEFKDFKEIVTRDNLERLQYEKPSVYRSIMANPDIYDQGYTAYEALKNFKKADPYEDYDRRIEENRQRPRSAASAAPQVGESPLTRAKDYDRRVLTDADRERIRRNVQAAKMNY